MYKPSWLYRVIIQYFTPNGGFNIIIKTNMIFNFKLKTYDNKRSFIIYNKLLSIMYINNLLKLINFSIK